MALTLSAGSAFAANSRPWTARPEIHLEPNVGQAQSNVIFVSQGNRARLEPRRDGAQLQLRSGQSSGDGIRLSWVGAKRGWHGFVCVETQAGARGDHGAADRQVAASVCPKPRLPVSVRIGGVNAEVLYAGAARSLVAGVRQVNLASK